MITNVVIIELVRKVKKGDNVAFTDLYNETYKYLHTCVIHIVKDEDVAQDMLQDTYVEIYKNIGQLKDDAGFLGWASTIANRKCFAYLKKDKDVLVDEQTDDEGNSTDYFENIADDEAFIPENIFDNIEKVNIIRGIIDELTDVQRACVIGFYYNEQKQDEIAEQLGIPVNTVKSHLNRAKSKIKEAVGDIEKKQGIKLLSVIPFMVALFGFETEAYAAELVVPAMSASVAGAVAIKGSVSAGVTASKATSATTAKVTETAAKSACMAIKTKIAIGAVVGALGIGTVAGTILSKRKEPASIENEEAQDIVQEAVQDNADENIEDKVKISNSIDVYISCKDLMDKIVIFGSPLSSYSRDLVESEVFSRVEKADAMYEKDFYSEEGEELTRWFDGPDQIGLYKAYPGRIDPNNENVLVDYDYYFDGTSDLLFDAGKRYFIKEDSYSSLRLSGGSDNGILNWMYYDNLEEKIGLSINSDKVENPTVLDYQFYLAPIDEVLNSISPDLFELTADNEEVLFNNGVIKSSDGDWYRLYFNDSANNGCMFNSILLFVGEDRNIVSVWISTEDIEGNVNPQNSISEKANIEFKDVNNGMETTTDDAESETASSKDSYLITLWYQGDQTVDELYYKMSKDSDWIFVGNNPLVAGDGYDIWVDASDINGYMAIKSVVDGKEYISESNDVRIGYITFVVQGAEEPHYAEGGTFDYVNAYFGLGGGIGMDWY